MKKRTKKAKKLSVRDRRWIAKWKAEQGERWRKVRASEPALVELDALNDRFARNTRRSRRLAAKWAYTMLHNLAQWPCKSEDEPGTCTPRRACDMCLARELISEINELHRRLSELDREAVDQARARAFHRLHEVHEEGPVE
jgi:hypothetical protein